MLKTAEADLPPPPAAAGWPYVLCDFFGTRVRYRAGETATLERIRFIFARFLIDPGLSCDVEFVLSAAGKGSFVRAILTPDRDARVHYRYPGERAWRPWPSLSTPFPPLEVAPLQGRFLVLHGCAVVDAAGQAIAVIAPSMAGKTTLLLELCRRGFACLSDDLLFICPQSLQVARYPKPVGIRAATLPLFPELAAAPALQQGLCFAAYGDSPQTWLCHLDELLPGCYATAAWAPLRACLFPDRGSAGDLQALSRSEALLQMLPQAIDSGLPTAGIVAAVTRVLGGCSAYRLGTADLAGAGAAVRVRLGP